MRKRIFGCFAALLLLFAVSAAFAVSAVVGGVANVPFADVLNAALPPLAITAVLTAFAARFAVGRLTDGIVKPLNEIEPGDFDGNKAIDYDELAPFLKKLARLKRDSDGTVAALNARADTINAIADNMREGLLLIDAGGTVLRANKSAADIFGESEPEQKNIVRVCRDAQFRRGLKKCLSGGNPEIVFKKKSKTYNVFFSPVYNDGAINGAVILFLDATEKSAAEKQRKQFSANVSHELKTPLTTILGLSEMIENGMAKGENAAEFAAKISAQAKRLLNIINDIIKLSEFDEGLSGKDDSVFDIYGLAETVIAGLRERAEERGVRIELKGGKTEISAEPTLFDELLYNLIDNGIKYNNPGGVVTVEVALRGDGKRVISVTDTGAGIPAKHQSRVFERFYRVDKSRSKKTGGTGLGLSIVKHITEEYGGAVHLESAPGEGTTVRCEF
ncbi:MAG: PAS domain-containing protein [Oscillospiraceae bacterium]|nr:PAS domain-containing protein [Oscillospiraceae bacterium]